MAEKEDRRGASSRAHRGSKLTRRTGKPGNTHREPSAFAFTPAQLAQRASVLPVITYPEELPVSARRDEIAKAIQDNQVVIILGETGSGKTTQLPKICLQLGRGIRGMIGHTQPRRLAARTVANRIAEELGTKVGNRHDNVVGFQVRFTDEVGPTTLVKLMTDGILLAEIQTDPNLTKYDTIIIDEAHERSLNIDFLIGYLTRLLPSRPDLKVIITSATIDSQRFVDHFASALGKPVPVVEISGRTYPVEIRYRPLSPTDPPARINFNSPARTKTDPSSRVTTNPSSRVTTDPSSHINKGRHMDGSEPTADMRNSSSHINAIHINEGEGASANEPKSAQTNLNQDAQRNLSQNAQLNHGDNAREKTGEDERAERSSSLTVKGLVLEDPDEPLACLGYGMGEDIDYLSGICEAVAELEAEGEGDILVFLPGERDIRDAESALRDHLGSRFIAAGQASAKSVSNGVEVLPLYSRLSAPQQQRVFEAHPRRRVVLATNVAETSLTVPGIRYVIDPGLVRISRYSNRTKVQRLPIEPVSQASANQRSGRCGRVSDGIAIRLYAQQDYDARPEYTEPEILRTSLASVILQMASLKLGAVEDFPFLDAPAAKAVRDGVALLEEIGAVHAQKAKSRNGRHKDGSAGHGGRPTGHSGEPTGHGGRPTGRSGQPAGLGGRPTGLGRGSALGDGGLRLTRIGHQLARLPIDPRLGRMLIEAQHHGVASEVLIIVAALSLQDIRERPAEFQQDADQAHDRFVDAESDFLTYLTLWRYMRTQSRQMSNSAFRRMCRQEFLHFLRWREWQDVVGQLRQLAKPLNLHVHDLDLPTRAEIKRAENEGGIHNAVARTVRDFTTRTSKANAEFIHRSLLVGLLSNLGNWDQQKSDYRGARGSHFVIWPGSGLAKKHYDWVMAAELVETSRLFARTVAKIDPAWVEPLASGLVRRQYSEPYWSAQSGAAQVREKVMLYGLTLVADRPVLLGNLDPDVKLDVSQASTSIAARAGVSVDGTTGFKGSTPKQVAREMFIRNALVDNQWRSNHKFLTHNRQLLDDIHESEKKLREGGHVSDEAIFAFYDERLPAEVISAQHFNAWWRRHRDKRFLNMTRADLLPSSQQLDPSGYPSQWVQGDLALPLRYEFEPGSARDGLTIQIPVAMLARVRDRGFEWLVPGMLEELLTATIRALPKQVRAQLVPAPDVARALAEWIRTNIWYANTTSEALKLSPNEVAGGQTVAGGADSKEPDARSLEASFGRLAAWAQKSGAANDKSIARMKQASKVKRSQGSPLPAAVQAAETRFEQPGADKPGGADSTQAGSGAPSQGADSPNTHKPDSQGSTQAGSGTASLSTARSRTKTPSSRGSTKTGSGAVSLNTRTPDSQSADSPARLPATKAGDSLPAFSQAFAAAAQAVRGVELPNGWWDELDLPTHVTPKFVAINDKGREVRWADDLTWLQRQLSAQSQKAVRSAMKTALDQALQEQAKQGSPSSLPSASSTSASTLATQAAPSSAEPSSSSSPSTPAPAPQTLATQAAPSSAEPSSSSSPSTPAPTTSPTTSSPAASKSSGGKRQKRYAPHTHAPSLQKIRDASSSRPSSPAIVEQTGLTNWPQGLGSDDPLPLDVQAHTEQGLSVRAYPALVAEGTKSKPQAGVRILAEQSAADRSHAEGLAQLVLARTALPTARVSTRWTGREALVLAGGPYPNTDSLIAQAQLAAVNSLINQYETPAYRVRSRSTFNDLAAWVQDRIEDRIYQILTWTVEAFTEFQALDRTIRAASSPSLIRLLQDVRSYTSSLVHAHFLVDTPYEWLPHISRFVRAERLRVDKASASAQALTRDEGNWRSVKDLESQLVQARAQVPHHDVVRARELDHALWLVSELRVSLFAQQLGTSQKVSLKRLYAILNAS